MPSLVVAFTSPSNISSCRYGACLSQNAHQPINDRLIRAKSTSGPLLQLSKVSDTATSPNVGFRSTALFARGPGRPRADAAIEQEEDDDDDVDYEDEDEDTEEEEGMSNCVCFLSPLAYLCNVCATIFCNINCSTFISTFFYTHIH